MAGAAVFVKDGKCYATANAKDDMGASAFVRPIIVHPFNDDVPDEDLGELILLLLKSYRPKATLLEQTAEYANEMAREMGFKNWDDKNRNAFCVLVGEWPDGRIELYSSVRKGKKSPVFQSKKAFAVASNDMKNIGAGLRTAIKDCS